MNWRFMMTKVDEGKCIGCGACEATCPEGFELKDRKAKVKDGKAPCVEAAIAGCPSGAITA